MVIASLGGWGKLYKYRTMPYYVPEGDSPLSLHATAHLSRPAVSTSASAHRTDVRTTIPAVQDYHVSVMSLPYHVSVSLTVSVSIMSLLYHVSVSTHDTRTYTEQHLFTRTEGC